MEITEMPGKTQIHQNSRMFSLWAVISSYGNFHPLNCALRDRQFFVCAGEMDALAHQHILSRLQMSFRGNDASGKASLLEEKSIILEMFIWEHSFLLLCSFYRWCCKMCCDFPHHFASVWVYAQKKFFNDNTGPHSVVIKIYSAT